MCLACVFLSAWGGGGSWVRVGRAQHPAYGSSSRSKSVRTTQCQQRDALLEAAIALSVAFSTTEPQQISYETYSRLREVLLLLGVWSLAYTLLHRRPALAPTCLYPLCHWFRQRFHRHAEKLHHRNSHHGCNHATLPMQHPRPAAAVAP